jgi:hypothetical protein
MILLEASRRSWDFFLLSETPFVRIPGQPLWLIRLLGNPHYESVQAVAGETGPELLDLGPIKLRDHC